MQKNSKLPKRRFNSIWPVDRTLSGVTTPSQSGPGTMSVKGFLHSSNFHHYWNLTIRLFSVITRTLVGGGGGVSYPSAEVQAVHSTAVADWAKDIVINKFKLQSCYYVHFRTNTLGKGMHPLIPPNWALDSTTK